MKNKLFVAALATVIVFVGLFMALRKNFEGPTAASQTPSVASGAPQDSSFRVVPVSTADLIKPHSPVKGAFSGKVTIVEFLDPECEACGAMSPVVKKVLKEHEADTKLVVRYMAFHQNSKYVANILEGIRAQAQGKYWEALELLFATQDQWANHHNPNPDLIPEILKPLKLNLKPILADAKAGKYDEQIMEDMEDGKKLGVHGTPTFFINGHELQELGYEPLKQAVEEKL